MPEYKLIYFNARGRAELIRWIFAYGDIAFTDERFERNDWPAKKQSEFTLKLTCFTPFHTQQQITRIQHCAYICNNIEVESLVTLDSST